MADWPSHFFQQFLDRGAAWFIGVVFLFLGLISSRLAEKVKFALNRADLRTKNYEELAIELSHFVFVIDRIIKVEIEGTWAQKSGESGEIFGAINAEYDETMNTICRKEYVYRSWLQRYWNKEKLAAFEEVMTAIRGVDDALIGWNEWDASKDLELKAAGKGKVEDKVKSAYGGLQKSVHDFLVTAM
jgi:hypothetical protein